MPKNILGKGESKKIIFSICIDVQNPLILNIAVDFCQYEQLSY